MINRRYGVVLFPGSPPPGPTPGSDRAYAKFFGATDAWGDSAAIAPLRHWNPRNKAFRTTSGAHARQGEVADKEDAKSAHNSANSPFSGRPASRITGRRRPLFLGVGPGQVRERGVEAVWVAVAGFPRAGMGEGQEAAAKRGMVASLAKR